jgi:succinate dehydrogenase / fumarate reductase cytochrome b subunit
MWLINSSIGKKFVMALTGICLVLFVTFHVLMNAVAICNPVAYNKVCQFLGANWYALIASIGLAVLFVIHIIYAIVLTLQNRKARGNDRYNVAKRPKTVEWSSNNMLVLGLVVVVFLIAHLCQFWYRMQAQELLGTMSTNADGVALPAAAGTLFIQYAFEQIWTPIVYIIGFVALWFHMNHGFWSMFQTIGWNNATWLPRLKKVACYWTSIVVLIFTVQAIVFTVRAQQQYYLTNGALLSQYVDMAQEHYSNALADAQSEFITLANEACNREGVSSMDQAGQMAIQSDPKAMEAYNKASELQDEMQKNIRALYTIGNKPTVPEAPTPEI